LSYTEYLRAVQKYIEQAELQLDGAELSPEQRPADVPLIYAETVRMLAIVERKP
jgi:hypothetical protein